MNSMTSLKLMKLVALMEKDTPLYLQPHSYMYFARMETTTTVFNFSQK